MRLVNDAQPIIFVAPGNAAKIIQQAIGALASVAAIKVATVIFNTAAEASLLDHFHVVLHAALQALRFHQLSSGAQFKNPLGQIRAHQAKGFVHLILRHHVVLGGKNKRGHFLRQNFAAHWIHNFNALHFVAKHANANGMLLVGGIDLDQIAAHAEGAALWRNLIAHVLHGD